jgi:UDP-glucose 4-epimerase
MPTSCSDRQTKHRWAYACSKLIDEFHALAYYKERKLPVIVVRLFNTVGPRQTGQYGMVIPNFVRQALANDPITVFGDGTQSPLVHLRGRRRARADGADGRAEGDRPGLQHRQRRRDLDPRPGRAGQGDDQLEASSPIVTHPLRPKPTSLGFEDMPRPPAGPDQDLAAGMIGYEPTRNLDAKS